MRTLIKPGRLDLRDMFSVNHILKSRGFKVSKIGGYDDLMIPKFHWNTSECDFFYNVFNSAINRTEIKQLIEKRIKDPSSELVKELILKDGFELDSKKYATSFEWYIGELIVREFSAFSYAYGVVIENIKRNSTDSESGDFDIISVLRNTKLIYVECKSGKSSNIEQKHILKCIERGLSLHCELTVMVIDDIINEDELLWSLKDSNHPLKKIDSINKIIIKGNPDSKIYEWGNCYFISSKKILKNNSEQF